MGLDELHLRVLATSSEDLQQKRNAQKGTHILGSWRSQRLIHPDSVAFNAERKTLGLGRMFTSLPGPIPHSRRLGLAARQRRE